MSTRTRHRTISIALLAAIPSWVAASALAQGKPEPWQLAQQKEQAEVAQKAPPVKPAPAKPVPAKPAVSVPAPAPAPAQPAQTPAAPRGVAAPAAPTDERRLTNVEEALYASGAMVRPEDAKRKALEDELASLEQQARSLDAAVKGGLDPESVKGALAGIRQRSEQISTELHALAPEAKDDEKRAKPPLLQRLEAVEASVKRLEAASTKAPADEDASAEAPAVSKPDVATGAAAAPVAKKEKPHHAFVVESADGSSRLELGGYLQARLAYEWLDGEDDLAAFSLPRARAGMKGNLFTKALTYRFEADFGQGKAELSYYYGDYAFIKDRLALRIGHQKRPFSRSYMTGSEKAQFISTAITGKAFGDATDLGVQIHAEGLHHGSPTPTFEYALGVFNGTGAKSTITGDVAVDPTTGKGTLTSAKLGNVPAMLHPVVVARLVYNQGDIQGYSEADLEGGPARFSIGVAGLVDLDADGGNDARVRGTVDGVLKVSGFSATGAVFVGSKQNGKSFGDQEHEATGFFAQTGYVIAETIEPELRYAVLSPVGSPTVHEGAAGINVYFRKHALKWQNEVDLKRQTVSGVERSDVAFLTQFQFIF